MGAPRRVLDRIIVTCLFVVAFFPFFFGFLLLLFGDDRARRLVTLLVQLMFVCFCLFVFLGYALTLGPSGGVSLFVCLCFDWVFL